MTPDTITREPSSTLLRWPLLSAADSLTATPATTGETTVSCKTTLTGQHLKDCQSYTALSNYLVTAGGIVHTAAATVWAEIHKSKPEAATDVWSLSRTVYELLAGVDSELIDAITDINKGKPYAPVETPAELPKFGPPPTSGGDAAEVLEGMWTTLEGVLNTVLAKYHGGEKMRIVIAGLLKNGNAAMQQLIPLLKHAFGN